MVATCLLLPPFLVLFNPLNYLAFGREFRPKFVSTRVFREYFIRSRVAYMARSRKIFNEKYKKSCFRGNEERRNWIVPFRSGCWPDEQLYAHNLI